MFQIICFVTNVLSTQKYSSIQWMETHYSLEEILLKQKIWENILMVIEDRFIFAFFSWKFSFYFKISMKNARIIFTFIWDFFYTFELTENHDILVFLILLQETASFT